MGLLGINGSPRIGNTYEMIKKVLDYSKEDYNIINLMDLNILGCFGDCYCFSGRECLLEDDFSDLRKSLVEADGIVLGSPTYFSNVSGLMKNFMDRCAPMYVSGELRGKNVALVTSANYPKFLEFDEAGRCIHHEKERVSAVRCLDSMRIFSEHLGMNIIGQVYALHSNPEFVKRRFGTLGNLFKFLALNKF